MDETYSIQPMVVRATRKDAKYPFDKLNSGEGFFISSEHQLKFPSIRVQICKYNKRTGRKLKSTVMSDGRLQVWLGSSSTVGNIKSIEIEATNPTKAEFQSYLRSMAVRQSFTVTDVERFEQFKEWAAETEGKFGALSLKPGHLTITRLLDAAESEK